MRSVALVAFAARAAAQTCVEPGTFTPLNFDQYAPPYPSVTQSNLGGLGPGGGAQELYFSNVGTAHTENSHNGAPVDVRIKALSTYRTANRALNGFGFNNNGRFGVINLRSPGPLCVDCDPPQPGGAGEWHADTVFTDFEVDLIHQPSGQLLDVTGGHRTFITFYDFDSLRDGKSNECLTAEVMGSGYVTLIPTAPFGTELVNQGDAATISSQWTAADPTYSGGGSPTGFAGAPLYCASQYGTAADNPSDPNSLTPLQAARSLTLDIHNTAQVKLRYLLHTAGGTSGRNFLFGGKTLPPCPQILTDPHFMTAHGDRFDFKGKHQAVYNLLSHQHISVNAFFEHVNYREAGLKKRLVHGSYMRTGFVTIATTSGKQVRVEYGAKAAKFVTYTVLDASGAEVASMKERLIEGWKATVEEECVLAYDGKALTVTTPEWTVTASTRVKPGVVGATSCATGKCFLEITASPRFDTDKAKVAPHGLIGQSYDQDGFGIVGNTDTYATSGNETSTEAMGEGAIEGVAADYEMVDNFATGFKYSRFGKESAAPRDAKALTGKKIKRVETAAKALDN